MAGSLRTADPTDGTDTATQPKRPDQSLGELFGELTAGIGTLIRQEMELAKTEAKEDVSRAGKAAGMFGLAGLAAWLTLIMLSFALAFLLDQAMNRALAFTLVGVIWAIVAAAMGLAAKKKVAAIEPLPMTKKTLKEDLEWAKEQKS